jgi:magnesium transporter
MARLFKKRTENKGLPPGSLVFIGTKRVEKPSIEYMAYDAAQLIGKTQVKKVEVPKEHEGMRQWYNVTGLDKVNFMRDMRDQFKIDPLAMEDIMNTGQRAKFEEFDEFAFITLKMLQFHDETSRVNSEQVSFVIKDNMLITFQEAPGDTFDAVRTRLENPSSNVRNWGPDYLAYALLDTIVDNYIYLVENLGEKIDDLELRVLENPDEEVLNMINTYKRELHFVLKVVKPVKELMLHLLRSNSPYIHKENTLSYYKDLQGLMVHAIESVEAYRTVLSDYIQMYHSAMSTKMNDIMKVLTIFSAIFIPLGFLAGVYGTNFQNLPELEYQYSYFIFWGVVISIGGGLLLYFKRKGWL